MKKVRSSKSSGCLGSCVIARGEEDGVNDSLLAGLDGSQLTGGKIGDRLLAEAETNLAINVIHGILLENMRRENFELSVSPPRVMYKIEKRVKLEPIEEVTIEVNEEHLGMVMEVLSHRRAEVTDMGPVAGNFGRTRMTLTWEWLVTEACSAVTHVAHDLCIVHSLVSCARGTVTSYALMSLESRGTLFVSPGVEAYDGMIVGEHSRDTDLDVGICSIFL
ncbi:unnamed protein product [Lactuca virosa]|uniref:Elongation factor EFG domain-containing protein n=1 Tax=Lactuca virosa TaxID=75947 RepID=A0AAU9PUD9_9ASTR|nr:unnamed protein product [Lactuca virosa]